MGRRQQLRVSGRKVKPEELKINEGSATVLYEVIA